MTINNSYNVSYSQVNRLESKESNQTTNNEKSEFDKMIWDLFEQGKGDVAHMAMNAQLVESIKENAKQNGISVTSVNWNRANANWREDFKNAGEQKQSEMVADLISTLQDPYAIQKGYYMGQAESEAHFQATKNQAIDYLSELLQDIKA
ncbi:hypothetical protein B6S12_09100 [Helicobacter valdiviensis]|uniref:Uncharacterized protein n=1 Tax=Helicobacter valdiviensis TaxID=1458358 RepID=A0A2W6MW14_9HELI|nr:hypothetical protein [Helicobacter valdiviensis]PZT47418.1 hypothetical protein B6S12_09100 [Helicobacter valdiviensis]